MARPKNSKVFPDAPDAIAGAAVAVHGKHALHPAFAYRGSNPFRWKVKQGATAAERAKIEDEQRRWGEGFGRLCGERLAEEDAPFFRDLAKMIEDDDPERANPLDRRRYWCARFVVDEALGLTDDQLPAYYAKHVPGYTVADETLYRIAAAIRRGIGAHKAKTAGKPGKRKKPAT